MSLSFDPFSTDFTKDPYRTYALLRDEEQPYYYPEMDAHLLARYEDVESAARNAQMVRSPESFMSPELIALEQQKSNFHDMPNHEQFVQFSMLEQDGESHRRLRLIVLREFSRTLIERHRHMIQQYVDKLLDELMEQGNIDFVADLATHVPGHVIGNILGVPDDECPQLRLWSENIVQYFDANRTPERKHIAEQATTEFYHYLTALIADRRRHPKNDLLTTLIAARDAGELNETELVSLCLLILAGGHSSTIDILGNGLFALLKHPEQLNLLRNSPSLISTAVQEMFRYDSPLPFFHRYASIELQVMGKTYPQGTKFGLLYGSANRDPRQFPEPNHFDISRSPNRHVAFGRGAHLCLGNNLARLDMEIIFLTLLDRTRDITLQIDEPAFKPGLSSRGISQLPISLSPR